MSQPPQLLSTEPQPPQQPQPAHDSQDSQDSQNSHLPPQPSQPSDPASLSIQPLLAQQQRQPSYGTLGSLAESNFSSYSRSDNDDRQSVLVRAAKFTKSRFGWFALIGICFMIIWQLSFLPRTSLSRDFRRWYGLRLTKIDVVRDYLLVTGINRRSPEGGSNTKLEDNLITPEESLRYSLSNISAINGNSNVNLIAENNIGLVKYIESKFQQYGLDPKLFTYDSYPVIEPIASKLQVIDGKSNSVLYDAKLFESPHRTPAYHHGGFNGEAHALYIFVNYGSKEDYELIVANDIDITNKIVVVREFDLLDSVPNSPLITTREKIQLAHSYGAVGFIIYSDYVSNDSNPSSVKRTFAKNFEASIVDRCSLIDKLFEDTALPTIPSIPVSYKAISPILQSFDSSVSSEPFKNWSYFPLPFSSTLNLHMSTKFSAKQHGKLVNIVGQIPGILKDSEVIIGASRDSFTLNNPLSSHAIILEIARGYQKLTQLGWRPLRTIKFISWDGTNSGKAGSVAYFNDETAYDKKMPLSGYINLDSDTIRGSRLVVDAHPELDHLVKNAAAYVPFPRVSVHEENSEEETDDEVNDSEVFASPDPTSSPLGTSSSHHTTSLFQYWKKQDKNRINNVLTEDIMGLDAINFQQHQGIPIVNLKFDNDPKMDNAKYPRNSNYYLDEWLKSLDGDMLLHGLIVRFAGLLAITLCDHEVTDHRIRPYAEKLNEFFDIVEETHEKVLSKWNKRDIPLYLINKEDIYSDLKSGPFDSPKILLNNLTENIHSILESIIQQSQVYDEYNQKIQDDLFTDYAWYHLFMKVKHYTQFKLANYKLLRLEQELVLSDYDREYTNTTNQTLADWFLHGVFGLTPYRSDQSTSFYTQRGNYSVYAALQKELLDEQFENTVRWMAVLYRKLKGYFKKIS